MSYLNVLRIACAALLLSACGGLRLRSPIAPAAGPPAVFVPTTSELRATRLIDVRDGLPKAEAFRAVSDLLAQRYSIDVSDPRAGFLMTPWQVSFVRDGVPDLRYRTRLVVRFLGDDWRQLSVRSEANWRRGEGWDLGYDDKMLNDVAIALKDSIGRPTGADTTEWR